MTDEAWWHQSQGDEKAKVSCNCKLHQMAKAGCNCKVCRRQRDGAVVEAIPQSMLHTDWTGSATFYHQALDKVPLSEMSEATYGGREVVESATGGKKGTKQARFDLIDQGFLWSLAEVCGFGAGIYGDNNWRKGYDWSLSYAALMRHLSLFLQGEDLDEESGMPHISHVAWHAMVLYVFSTDGLYREYDTRGEQG